MWSSSMIAADMLGLLLCASPGLLRRQTQDSPMAGEVMLALMMLFSAVDSMAEKQRALGKLTSRDKQDQLCLPCLVPNGGWLLRGGWRRRVAWQRLMGSRIRIQD